MSALDVSRKWHVAQINVAFFRVPRSEPVNADFDAALDAMNALAEAAPGFVWRMPGEGESEDPGITINMTVWKSIEALAAFAYRNATHRSVLRRKKEWFVEAPAYLALWWVPAGTVPTLAEGMAKLELIGKQGPTPEAFDFKTPFPQPA